MTNHFLYRRREFITLLGCVSATWPLAARAEQSDRMRSIAVLMNNAEDDPEGQTRAAAFRQGAPGPGGGAGEKKGAGRGWDAGGGGRSRTHRGGSPGGG